MTDQSLPLPSRTKDRLTRRQKAAIVVHLLISGGVDPGLRDMPPDQQRGIVREMARLRFVDRETLAGVIAEFASELDSIGLHFPSDMGRVLSAMNEQLSLDVLDTLTSELGPDADTGDGPWHSIAALDVETIVELASGETDEVCAILLSKLPADKAAELMGSLPAERATAVVAAFARTENVAPAAVARIGVALGRQTATRTSPAFATDSVLRVGGILNVARSSLRRTILETLDGTDPEFAARVRKTVFSYENISTRVDPRDLPKVLREVDAKELTNALAATPTELQHVREFILGSISTRMADQIREEIEELGTPPTDEVGEAAMAAIVAAIRKLEESGDLTLLSVEQ